MTVLNGLGNEARDAIESAAAILRSGGVVAIPTETVYGLAANAFNDEAVAKIFAAKQRPSFDPLIVHIAQTDELSNVAVNLSPIAIQLANAFWPGPLTMVVEKSQAVSSLVTSGLDTVAVRQPNNVIAQEIIKEAGVPLAAPSANSFGKLSPTRAEHVVVDLGNRIDAIVDGGSCEHGVESTIVDVTVDPPVVLRFGALAIEDIERIISPVAVSDHSTSNPKAPGQLESHYAPGVPLKIVETFTASPEAGFLAFEKVPLGEWKAGEVLSAEGDVIEAAAKLFDALHRLDASGASYIEAELVPDVGLGRAINDRLKRAAIN